MGERFRLFFQRYSEKIGYNEGSLSQRASQALSHALPY